MAIYAWVSSEQQAQAGTIGSQLTALQQKVAQDGLQLSEELTFVDECYSGSTLIRPVLEQLRDVVAPFCIKCLSAGPPFAIPGAAITNSKS